jgi:hypothetical protein
LARSSGYRCFTQITCWRTITSNSVQFVHIRAQDREFLGLINKSNGSMSAETKFSPGNNWGRVYDWDKIYPAELSQSHCKRSKMPHGLDIVATHWSCYLLRLLLQKPGETEVVCCNSWTCCTSRSWFCEVAMPESCASPKSILGEVVLQLQPPCKLVSEGLSCSLLSSKCWRCHAQGLSSTAR